MLGRFLRNTVSTNFQWSGTKYWFGIVTDRDLRDAPETFAISSQPIDAETPRLLPDPAGIHVEDVMTANLVTLSPEDTVEQAAQLMMNNRVGGIPIVEENLLVAIVTRADVLRAFLFLTRQHDALPHDRARRTSRKKADQEV
jgi:signal-transduction protein with cAMP-binding, CBS, and nucleotidyltransferase domain